MELELERQLEVISKGVVSILPIEALRNKLITKSPLKIKLGADPTAPDLHLGHVVILQKMKDFQEMGHEVIFLIGDFTAFIGDPTGKSKTRPSLTKEQIVENSKTYLSQVFRLLDPKKTKVVFNSFWLEKLTAYDFVKLCAKTTIMQLLEREDFKNRIKNAVPVGFHELLYSILQAYDSVELEADVEMGGTDQTFNLMFGRGLQEQFGQDPQVVITLPILVGLDGEKKMSKSLGNYVGLSDSAEDSFGKLMSMPDNNIFHYYKILMRKDEFFLTKLKEDLDSCKIRPIDAKKDLAFSILEAFWGVDDAEKGKKYFEAVFQNKDYEEVQELNFVEFNGSGVWVVDLLKKAELISSSSEAKRLIESGAVLLNGSKILDFKQNILLVDRSVLKIGKKVFRIIL